MPTLLEQPPPRAKSPLLDAKRPAPGGMREAIVRAALDLFAERGYVGTSLEEIGRAVHITAPAIYRHFDSKEDLLIAAHEYASRGRREVIEESGSLPDDEALELLLRTFVEWTLHEPQWTKVWLMERGGRFAESFDRATGERQRAYASRWTEVIAALRPDLALPACRELVHLIWGAISGTVYYPTEMAIDERAVLLMASARSIIEHTIAEPSPPHLATRDDGP